LLPGVTVTIDGTDISTIALFGHFVIREVPAGNITLKYGKADFIQAAKGMTVASNIAVGGAADVSMSPEMANDQWRVVLKWGEKPRDLDSYAKWGSNKVCWSNMQQDGAHMSAQLEHDDTNSFGPETIHLSDVGKCRGDPYYCDIRYYVHDYNQGGKLLSEPTDVTLYTGEKVAGAWHIGDCPTSVSEDRNWWHVFTLDGATNKLKWTCLDGPSPAPLSIDFMLRNMTPAEQARLSMKQHLRSQRALNGTSAQQAQLSANHHLQSQRALNVTSAEQARLSVKQHLRSQPALNVTPAAQARLKAEHQLQSQRALNVTPAEQERLSTKQHLRSQRAL